MSNLTNLTGLLTENLNNAFNSEHQQLEELPGFAKKAKSPELQQAIINYLDKKIQHLQRIQETLSILNIKLITGPSPIVNTLISQGNDFTENITDSNVCDAALISSMQQINHYDIANYGTLASYAKALGQEKVANLLQSNLDEEKETDRQLTKIAETKITPRMKRG